MKILICNYFQIEYIKPEVPYLVYSITDKNSKHPKIPKTKYRKQLVKLKFHDIDNDLPQHGLYIITEKDAEKIINTLMEYKNKVKLIICQCDGGISRSAGVAVAISRILGLGDNWIYNQYIPNNKVVSTIMRVYEKMFDK